MSSERAAETVTVLVGGHYVGAGAVTEGAVSHGWVASDDDVVFFACALTRDGYLAGFAGEVGLVRNAGIAFRVCKRISAE